jgi:Mrp family chromosome partitioning ATPase
MISLIVVAIKGGVGKTTVTVELARAYRRCGLQVGVLDLDYRNPECPLFLNCIDRTLGRTESDMLIPVSMDGIHIFSMAYIWPNEKAVLVEDNDATSDIMQLLSPGVIAWPHLDVLIADSPPTSAGIIATALKPDHFTGAVLISHPSSASRAALLRTLDLFSEKQVPVFGLVSNQGVDERGENRFDLQDQDIIDLAATYGLPWCFCIPHTRTLELHFDGLAQCILRTEPVLLAKPKEPQGVAWDKIITLAQQLTGAKPRAKS